MANCRRLPLLSQAREHWYGHFADEDPKKILQEWNRDGTHVTSRDWSLKILEFDD